MKLISNRFYVLIKKELVSVHGVFMSMQFWYLKTNVLFSLFILLGMKSSNSFIKLIFFHYAGFSLFGEATGIAFGKSNI